MGDDKQPNLSRGSGRGKFVYGEKIQKISDFAAGDLVINDSAVFDSTNLVRILGYSEIEKSLGVKRGSWTDVTDRVYGIFVDPENPGMKRLKDDRPFVIWDFELAWSDFHRAVLPPPEVAGVEAKPEREL